MNKLLNKQSIAFAIAVVLIIFLHYIGILPKFENYLVSFINPVEKVVFKGGNKIQKYYDTKTDKRDLFLINKNLEEENKKLLEENVNLKILTDENIALREQLKFYTQRGYNKVIANIIKKGDSTEVGRIITIDKGILDTIDVGQPIIADNGIIIGKIFAVEDRIAHGYLITDRRCEMAVEFLGVDGTNGITSGDLGLTVQMNFIPQESTIFIDSLVITSGLEAQIPKGLILGKVQEIIKETNDLFQTAIINPAVKLETVSVVSVIVN